MYSNLENNELKNAIINYYRDAEQKLGKTHQIMNQEIREQWESSLGKEGVLTSNVMTLNDPLDLIRRN